MKEPTEKLQRKRLIVGITGASGALYGVRLAKALLELDFEVHLIVSSAGEQVLACETGISGLPELVQRLTADHPAGRLILHEHSCIAAPIASGSFKTGGMAVAPCSMGTLAAISQGLAQNLITRSADVCLKERRPLVLMVRETPLNAIHLENMLKLARMGAVILPAMPAFYQNPRTLEELVDFMTGRALDALGVPHTLYRGYREED